MKLKDLAEAVGKSPPAVMTLQRKYGLPVYDDYSDGYSVLLQKTIYLTVFSVPTTDIKALLRHERSLLELLKVDSLHDKPDWFESLCTMHSGPTRLLLSGHDIGHTVSGNTVQTGLDFKERARELFEDREMGADVLRSLNRYAETFDRVRRKLAEQRDVVQQAQKWCRKVSGTWSGCRPTGRPAPTSSGNSTYSSFSNFWAWVSCRVNDWRSRVQ